MSKNNTSRELFLLFTTDNIYTTIEGYTLIYKHTAPNDEPPYIQVEFYGIGKGGEDFVDEGDYYNHYLIRTQDVHKFINLMNTNQTDYLDYYLEGIYTRNAGEHKLSAKQYADGANLRKPKIKYINNLPTIMKSN